MILVACAALSGRVPASMHLFRSRGPSDLERAVEAGDISRVRILLQKGGDIERPNQEGQTLLSVAARKGFDVLVGELLDRKANPSAQDKYGRTALHWAADGGHVKCVQHLVGPRNTDPNKQYMLNFLDGKKYTAVLLACARGSEEAVHALLAAGASASQTVNVSEGLVHAERVSAVHIAAQGGFVPTLMVLKNFDADLDARTADLCSPLHYAAAAGQASAVQWLLHNGAKVEVKNMAGKLPFDLAREEGQHRVLDTFKQFAEAQKQAKLGAGAGGGAGGGGGHSLLQPAGVPALAHTAQQPASVAPAVQPYIVYPEREVYKNYPSLTGGGDPPGQAR